jgi:hypothetical protein
MLVKAPTIKDTTTSHVPNASRKPTYVVTACGKENSDE